MISPKKLFEEVTLEGAHVRLEPIARKHKDGLCQAISDGELWTIFYTFVPHPDDIDSFIDDAIQAQQYGDGLVFVIIDKMTNKVAGSTRFLKADLNSKKLRLVLHF